jgi:hypothetical protein
MISSPEESADTNSLLPLSPSEDRGGGGGGGSGVLRQGSKKLWRKLSSRETGGMSNVESQADLEAELEEDRNAGNYNLLNNLNNQRQPRYSPFFFVLFFCFIRAPD